MSFDYEYQTENCELQSVIEGPGVHLRISGSYRNFERLGSGHSAWFEYDNLPLIHGEVYYINARIVNNMGTYRRGNWLKHILLPYIQRHKYDKWIK